MAVLSQILQGLGLVGKSGDIAHPDFKSLLRPCPMYLRTVDKMFHLVLWISRYLDFTLFCNVHG